MPTSSLAQLGADRWPRQQHQMVGLASNALDEAGTKPVLVCGILDAELITT